MFQPLELTESSEQAYAVIQSMLVMHVSLFVSLSTGTPCQEGERREGEKEGGRDGSE